MSRFFELLMKEINKSCYDETGERESIADIQQISELLANLTKEELSVCDSYGDTLLDYACRVGRLDIMNLLISHGADMTAQILGLTWRALEYGRLDIAEFLLYHSAYVDITGQVGADWLETLCRDNKNDAAKLLIMRGANPNPPSNCAPLTYACGRGDIGFVKFLLENGANPNEPASIRYTSPWNKLLDIYLCGTSDWRAYKSDKCFDEIKLLIKHGLDCTHALRSVIYHATEESDHNDKKIAALVEMLIDNNADINLVYTEWYMFQPFMITSTHLESGKIIQLLLGYGAQIDLKDIDKDAALIKVGSNFARCEKGDAFKLFDEMIRCLVKNGANIDKEIYGGGTLLVNICKYSGGYELRLKFIQLYIELGASINNQEVISFIAGVPKELLMPEFKRAIYKAVKTYHNSDEILALCNNDAQRDEMKTWIRYESYKEKFHDAGMHRIPSLVEDTLASDNVKGIPSLQTLCARQINESFEEYFEAALELVKAEDVALMSEQAALLNLE